MSELTSPFRDKFMPAYTSFYHMNGRPTHLLIGRREFEDFQEELRMMNSFTTNMPFQGEKTTYCDVEILRTPDIESIMKFFVHG